MPCICAAGSLSRTANHARPILERMMLTEPPTIRTIINTAKQAIRSVEMSDSMGKESGGTTRP